MLDEAAPGLLLPAVLTRAVPMTIKITCKYSRIVYVAWGMEAEAGARGAGLTGQGGTVAGALAGGAEEAFVWVTGGIL